MRNEISVKYDGAALQNGEMDVRDVAQSLLAMADLSRALYGDTVEVKVKEFHKKGGDRIDPI